MVHASKRLFTYIVCRYNSWCKLGMYTKGKHSPYAKAISVSGYRQCAQRDAHKQKAALTASLFILALLIQKSHVFLLICLSVILKKYRCRFSVMLQSVIIEDEQQYGYKLEYNKELLLCLSRTICISVNWHTHVSCTCIYPHCDLYMLVSFNIHKNHTHAYTYTIWQKWKFDIDMIYSSPNLDNPCPELSNKIIKLVS